MASFIAPLVGAGASIISGILGGGAAKRAGAKLKAAGDASGHAIENTVKSNQEWVSGATTAAQGGVDAAKNQANDVVRGAYGEQKENLNPYLEAGRSGVTSLQAAYAPGGSLAGTFHAPTADEAAATPGYEFTRNEGTKAVQRSAAASGSLASGGTMKALDQYSQGLASTYYQQAYNNALQSYQTNHQNTLQGYMALTGVGQNATGQFNSAAQNYGNLTSANTLNSAQYVGNTGIQGAEYNAGYGLQGSKIAQDYFLGGAAGDASGTIGAGNAWQNALGGVAGAAGDIASRGYRTTGGTVSDMNGSPVYPGSGGYNPATYSPSYVPPGQYTPSYAPPLPAPYVPQMAPVQSYGFPQQGPYGYGGRLN